MNINSKGMLKCEHLRFDILTSQQIKEFKVTSPGAEGLELWLKNYSASDEANHSNRTYLVRDCITNEIACYFSLRNGLFTIPVEQKNFATVPAIELSNFAVNDAYKAMHPNTSKIGTITFREFIIPIVKQIQEQTGVRALYIYALPNDKLIEHYSSLGFMRFDPEEEAFIHNHVKPLYDKGCVFMCQGV